MFSRTEIMFETALSRATATTKHRMCNTDNNVETTNTSRTYAAVIDRKKTVFVLTACIFDRTSEMRSGVSTPRSRPIDSRYSHCPRDTHART